MKEDLRRPERRSLSLRIALAISLMAGFYLFAVSLVGVLLWLVYFQLAVAHRLHLGIVAVCLAGAFAVLKGCLFVGGRFEAPGPEILEKDEPRLFAVIRDVTERMGGRAVSKVYFIPDVNAFVAEAGGVIGHLGSRRVMAVGIGLLNTDSIGQFRATLAHELGHFEGGDTRLSGFVCRTRASIGRVIGQLGENSWLSIPFDVYGRLFMRITQSIGRRQELDADRYSIRIAGRKAHVEGLKSEGVGGVLFERFLDTEVVPLLQEGFIPTNLYDGFRQFLANLGEDGVAREVEGALHRLSTDPYDSHPALAERLAFAGTVDDQEIAEEPEIARSLLENPGEIERNLTVRILTPALAQLRIRNGVKPVEWQDVAERVYSVRMARTSEEVAGALGQPGGGAIDALLRGLESEDPVAFAHLFASQAFRDPCDDARDVARAVLRQVLLARIGSILVARKAFRWETSPGRPLGLVDSTGASIDLDTLIAAAVQERGAVPALRERLAGLGLTGSAG